MNIRLVRPSADYNRDYVKHSRISPLCRGYGLLLVSPLNARVLNYDEELVAVG